MLFASKPDARLDQTIQRLLGEPIRLQHFL